MFATVPSAAADPGPATDIAPPSLVKATHEEDPSQLAIAVNPPLRWSDGGALAASASVGFARHHAIRANVASYDNKQGLATLVGDVFFDGDGDDAIRTGRITDVGIGYTYFPRRLWSGPLLEAGLLLRNTSTRVEDDFASVGIVETHTNTYAARALIGWSWLFYGRAFVSLSVGASRGLERGRETTSMSTFDPKYETHDVSRSKAMPEGFLRIGGVFDL